MKLIFNNSLSTNTHVYICLLFILLFMFMTLKYDDHRFGMRTEVDKKGLLFFKTEAHYILALMSIRLVLIISSVCVGFLIFDALSFWKVNFYCLNAPWLCIHTGSRMASLLWQVSLKNIQFSRLWDWQAVRLLRCSVTCVSTCSFSSFESSVEWEGSGSFLTTGSFMLPGSRQAVWRVS